MKNVLLCFGGVAVAEVFMRNIPLPNVVASIPALAVASVLGFGYGLFFGVLGRRWWVVQDLRIMLMLLLFMTSGLYSISPSKMSLLNEWYNPMYHIIQTQRHALYPSFPLWQVTLLYPISWALGMVFLGLLLNRLAEDMAEEWVLE
jgi:capsular polysaccharide transport system permease protein